MEWPALQEVIKLLLHVLLQGMALRLQLGEKRQVVPLDKLIEQRLFGVMACVARRVGKRTIPVGQ